MNLFVIPSWYPTDDYPSTGIFFKEQTRLMAQERSDWSIGVSLWGSHEPKLWLKATRPFHSLIQYASKFPIKRHEKQLATNLAEFFHPAYTWSRRLFQGNIKGITEANKHNLSRYIQVFGKPDIIHAHISYPAGYVAMELSKEFNIPYVLTEQMSPFPLPAFRSDFKKYLLPPLKNAGAVLSVGENLSEELKRYGIQSVPTSNFIDMERFSLHDPENPIPVIFALGRLVDQKGFDLLLKVMTHIGHKPWKLKIGGSGAMEPKLEKMISEFGLSDRISLLGELSQKEIAKEMQACDFFVLSSRHESFGIVLLEAMASGKPIVYTRCGGLTSSLPEFVGMACDISEGSLSATIDRMLDGYGGYDPVEVRKYVEESHSAPVVAKQLEALYASLINLRSK